MDRKAQIRKPLRRSRKNQRNHHQVYLQSKPYRASRKGIQKLSVLNDSYCESGQLSGHSQWVLGAFEGKQIAELRERIREAGDLLSCVGTWRSI